MNLEKKRELVNSNESERFYLDKNKVLRYKCNDKIVSRLSILVDFQITKDTKPVVLKYGNYEKLLKYMKIYSERDPEREYFDIRIVEVPNELYKWVDMVFDISTSNWIYYLMDEIKEFKKN